MLRFAHLASLAAAFAACLVVSVPTGSGGVGPSSFGPTRAPSTTTSTTSTVTTSTSSATSACGSGPAIVAVTSGTPVSGYSLAGGVGTPILVSGTSYYPYSFGQSISRQGAADNCLNVAYFNLHDNGNSYVPISWDVGRELTMDWDGSSSVIQTRNNTQWGVQSWFLACAEQGYWAVYLQTGKDTPSGETCYLTQLQTTN
ncbi:hypothetical protein FRC04_007431 [Tulasnella sp. 424]|nr:hypothetical protein FRC04_007431 [Tulasnella sp. 424]KAG8975126.1 hypothetical protein FRC05_006294 [Tulasnella sp. 425]